MILFIVGPLFRPILIFDISVSISQNRVIDCFHSMSIADIFTTAIWTGKKLPFKLNIVVSFTIFCRNKEIFQIRISDVEKSCDKNSIKNHRVSTFVIRVLCLNTLYAKGYFFLPTRYFRVHQPQRKNGLFLPTRYFREYQPQPNILERPIHNDMYPESWTHVMN